ncbi:MAG: hypothetical protein KBS64_01675, partial [Treponema sp.]|nr:hypothetical protein [Candidatus Treponema equi]
KITLSVTTALILIIGVIAFLFTKPFNEILSRLSVEGGIPSAEDKEAVINTYKKLNMLTVAGCLMGFVVGNSVSLFIKIGKGAIPAEPDRIVLAIIQSVIFGILVCFYVMFITNEMFAKYRSYLHIHVYDSTSIFEKVGMNIYLVAAVGILFVFFNMYIVPFGLIKINVGDELSTFLSSGARIGLLSIVMALGALAIVVVSLQKRIRDAKNAIDEIRDGSLSSRIDIIMFDDFANLTTSMNKLIKKLNVMIKELRAESDIVNSTAGKLASVSDDASVAMESMSESFAKIQMEGEKQNNEISNAGQNVSGLTSSVRKVESHVLQETTAMQQSSASITEMTENIKSVADMTKKADEVSILLSKTCETGNKALKATTDTIEAVHGAFNEVQEIVKAIQNIANQTNLLSMNASIEAAHAGEFGKGFSVVAGEVRALAGNAAKSADDIQTLIKGTMEKIKNSVESIGETQAAFLKIQEYTGQNSELVRTISSAMEEQKDGAEENLRTTESIVADTRDIKDLVSDQNHITQNVEESMKSVVESSGIMMNAIKESVKSSDSVKNVIGEINDMIIQNKNAVSKMNEMLGQFDV